MWLDLTHQFSLSRFLCKPFLPLSRSMVLLNWVSSTNLVRVDLTLSSRPLKKMLNKISPMTEPWECYCWPATNWIELCSLLEPSNPAFTQKTVLLSKPWTVFFSQEDAVGNNGRINSLDLLVILCLMQPRILIAFLAPRAHCSLSCEIHKPQVNVFLSCASKTGKSFYKVRLFMHSFKLESNVVIFKRNYYVRKICLGLNDSLKSESNSVFSVPEFKDLVYVFKTDQATCLNLRKFRY